MCVLYSNVNELVVEMILIIKLVIIRLKENNKFYNFNIANFIFKLENC
jgi:hypothetical protein